MSKKHDTKKSAFRVGFACIIYFVLSFVILSIIWICNHQCSWKSLCGECFCPNRLHCALQAGFDGLALIYICVCILPTILIWFIGKRIKAKRNTAPAEEQTVLPQPAPPQSTILIPADEQIALSRDHFFHLITITITNKRVMYKGILWKRVNLPLNRISAVGTSIFCSLHIGSSAGRIHMMFFGHYREVYETISTLLNNVE